MATYRILERRNDEGWAPFGVAYEREGRFVLFAPPWRADRELEVTSLEDLDERHRPSDEFRWQPVAIINEPMPHPIELLQHALDPQSDEKSIRAQLIAALSYLTTAHQNIKGRLLAWREELARGAVSSAEAVLRAVLVTDQEGTIEVLPTLSHKSLEFGYAGGSLRSESGPPPDEAFSSEAERSNLVVITTNDVLGAKVIVGLDRVTVTFLDWQEPISPLVMLVPEAERGLPQLPELTRGEAGKWIAKFTHLPAGKYLLAVAPVSK